MNRSLLLVLLMIVSACAGAENPTRTISVTGTGSADASPDRATLTMSIVERDKSLDVAQDGAANVTAKVLEITDGLKIDRNRVDTTGASVRPDYRYNRDTSEQELRGYIAERQIKVEIRDLDNLAKVIEGAVAAGVNQVSAPQLFSSKQREAYREALDSAANDAKANAEQLAETLGMQLGAVLQIDAGSRPSPMPVARGAVRAMAMDAEATESYNPGDLSVHTTINVIFELSADN